MDCMIPRSKVVDVLRFPARRPGMHRARPERRNGTIKVQDGIVAKTRCCRSGSESIHHTLVSVIPDGYVALVAESAHRPCVALVAGARPCAVGQRRQTGL